MKAKGQAGRVDSIELSGFRIARGTRDPSGCGRSVVPVGGPETSFEFRFLDEDCVAVSSKPQEGAVEKDPGRPEKDGLRKDHEQEAYIHWVPDEPE